MSTPAANITLLTAYKYQGAAVPANQIGVIPPRRVGNTRASATVDLAEVDQVMCQIRNGPFNATTTKVKLWYSNTVSDTASGMTAFASNAFTGTISGVGDVVFFRPLGRYCGVTVSCVTTSNDVLVDMFDIRPKIAPAGTYSATATANFKQGFTNVQRINGG